MGNQIKKTGDGSTTLISKQFNQPFHSLNGAVAESRYVYFKTSGLAENLYSGGDLSILEIGFGSGMNLVLLMDYLEKSQADVSVTFTTVEAYPIEPALVSEIDFGEELRYLEYRSLLQRIFSTLSPGWNRHQITPDIKLNLFVGMFDEPDYPEDAEFDYILHDPFSPDSNPAGWTAELFKTIADHSISNAMLTTYSAATSARAAMAVAGWNIARAPGALGKREMTVGSLNPEKLSHLKRVNEKRLIERHESGEFG